MLPADRLAKLLDVLKVRYSLVLLVLLCAPLASSAPRAIAHRFTAFRCATTSHVQTSSEPLGKVASAFHAAFLAPERFKAGCIVCIFLQESMLTRTERIAGFYLLCDLYKSTDRARPRRSDDSANPFFGVFLEAVEKGTDACERDFLVKLLMSQKSIAELALKSAAAIASDFDANPIPADAHTVNLAQLRAYHAERSPEVPLLRGAAVRPIVPDPRLAPRRSAGGALLVALARAQGSSAHELAGLRIAAVDPNGFGDAAVKGYGCLGSGLEKLNDFIGVVPDEVVLLDDWELDGGSDGGDGGGAEGGGGGGGESGRYFTPRTPTALGDVRAEGGGDGATQLDALKNTLTLLGLEPELLRPTPPILGLEAWGHRFGAAGAGSGGASSTAGSAPRTTLDHELEPSGEFGLGDVIWLNPEDGPMHVWDASMCEDTSRGVVVRELMEKALRGPLKPAEQTEVTEELAQDSKLIYHCGTFAAPSSFFSQHCAR